MIDALKRFISRHKETMRHAIVGMPLVYTGYRSIENGLSRILYWDASRCITVIAGLNTMGNKIFKLFRGGRKKEALTLAAGCGAVAFLHAYYDPTNYPSSSMAESSPGLKFETTSLMNDIPITRADSLFLIDLLMIASGSVTHITPISALRMAAVASTLGGMLGNAMTDQGSSWEVFLPDAFGIAAGCYAYYETVKRSARNNTTLPAPSVRMPANRDVMPLLPSLRRVVINP